MFQSCPCPVTTTLSVLGGKWKPVILALLRDRVLRFGELKRQLNGITQKMLTQQLREMEGDGIVYRKVYAVVPPKVEYFVTEYGMSLFNSMLQSGNYVFVALKEQKTESGAAICRRDPLVLISC